MLMMDRKTLEVLAIRGLKGGGPTPAKSPIALDSPLYTLIQHDPADTVFTAVKNMRVLCMNTMIIHEAGQAHASSATTTTTGTKVNELTLTTDFGSGYNRDATTVVSLIDLAAGDTVTMSNDSRSYNVVKNRMIWLADDVDDIFDVLYDTVVDDAAFNPTRELTYDNSNIYMTYVYQTSANNNHMSASITVSEGTQLDSYTLNSTNNSIASVVCKNPSDLLCTTADETSYVSKMYAVIKLVPK